MKKRGNGLLIFFTVLFILGLLALAGFFLLWPKARFTSGEHILERGVAYKAEDFIARSTGEIIPQNEYLYTDEVGEFKFRYTAKKWFIEREAVLTYKVEDTTPPVISFAEETVYKDPGAKYTEDEMRKNVILDEEGTLSFETDYDPGWSGTFTVNVTAEDQYGNVSSAKYLAVVKDVEKPVVFRSGNGRKIIKGNDFDIVSIVSYGDNADPVPTLTFEGEVNTSVIGDYPLHLKVEDHSGNSTEWDITVHVVDEIPKDDSEDLYYPFEDFAEDYAGEGRLLGLDISEWQGDVDFEAVKDAGCDFVIIRIGFSWKGVLTVDKKFHQNLEGAKEAGIPVGIYLFVYDNTEADLRNSMESMFAELGDTQLDLPIVFDWENFGNYHEYEISFQELNKLYDIFEETVEEKGYESMLYGSQYYLNTVFTHTDKRPIWLAQYISWPTYTKPYQIWQCADNGTIDGIYGQVDLNILFR